MVLFIKIALAFLAFFTAFAFAGAEPWAFSVMQIGIICCGALWLWREKEVSFTRPAMPVIFIFLFLLLLGTVQTSFPQTLLSPAPYHPVTLMRLFTLEHLSLLVTYGTLCFLISQLFPSQSDIKYVLGWIIFCAVAVGICASSFSKGEYIRYFTGLRSGVGPFLNRNHAAVFLAMGAISALGWIFFRQTKPERSCMHLEQRHRFYMEQLCGWLIFTGLCGAVIFTRSRGGMMSLFAGLFCFAFLMTGFFPSKIYTKLKGLIITGSCLTVFTYWVVTHIAWINTFSMRAKGTSAEIRLMLYRAARDLLAQFPLWGIGLGAMPVALPPYFKYPLPRYVEHLHNDWLELALGIGYAGIIPVLCAILCLAGIIIGRMKHLPNHKLALFAATCSALFAMSLGSTVDFHFFIPANAFIFFVLLGILCAPTFDKHHILSVRLPLAVRLCLIIVLASSLYIPLQKTLAWRSALFGKGLKQEAKLIAYQDALSHYPSPRFAVKLGNAYLNASHHAKTPEEQEALRAQGFEVAQTFLLRYPKEPDLSKLYVRTRPRE